MNGNLNISTIRLFPPSEKGKSVFDAGRVPIVVSAPMIFVVTAGKDATLVLTSTARGITFTSKKILLNLAEKSGRLRAMALSLIALICCSFFTAGAQPVVDIGLYNNGSDTLEVRLTPKGFFNGVVSNVVFTLRWQSGCGSSLGTMVQTGLPAIYIPMTKSGNPQTSNGYTYQVFGGAGMQTLSSLGANWSNGVAVTLLKVPVVNKTGTFEIVNDEWTGVATNNGNYFVSLNGLKKTGAIVGGMQSFIETGTASICLGDSILLGGVYRKNAGTYFDTLQDPCRKIVLTTLTVNNATSSSRSVSICQGQSFFAGGAWQTESGTYYDTYSTSSGCDSLIITNLTVYPSDVNHIFVQICQGQSIIAGGNYQTQSGTYYDTLHSRYGCDSIVVTHLDVLSQLITTKNVSICSGQSYFAGGANRTTTGTYYDTYTSSDGCDSVVITNLTVNPNPVVSISPSSVAICSGTSTTLTANASGGISYSWSTGATSPAIIVSPTSSTSYFLTVTNSSGCTAIASRSVTVNPAPSASIFPSSVSICNGSGATLTTGGGVSYVWSTGATTAFITVFPAVTTGYSVTVTDSNGCTATASRIVNVNPQPIPGILPATAAICSGSSITLSASGGSLYSWNTGAATSSITVSPASTTSYSVTVTNASGCSAAAARTVTVIPTLSATISPAVTSICTGQSTTLTASGGTTFLWSTGATTASISVSPASTSVYSVTVGDGNGCSAVVSAQVNVNPLPAAAISPATVAICSGASAILTASGGVSYVWSTGENSADITVSPSTGGTYSVTVTDANGCTAADSRFVAVNTLPAASITPATAMICRGSSIVLTADGGASYSWNTGATSASVTVNPFNTTNYSVTVTNGSGCSASLSRTVMVNPLPASSITPASVAICSGQSVTLTASGGTSFIWNTGATTQSITVNPNVTTGYSVTVFDVNGCSSATAGLVTVNALPSISISPATMAVCAGESATLTASGGTTYSWSTGSVNTSITVSPASTSSYSVTATGSNGCSTSASRTVTVNPVPAAAINPSSATICSGSSITLTATGGISYSWSTGSVNASISVSPNVNTSYQVTVTDASGCTDTAMSSVAVRASLFAYINGNAAVCSGQSTVLSASGGINYSWSTGATTSSITVSPLTFSTYYVTVTDGGNCSATASKDVMVNTLPVPSISPSQAAICSGAAVTLTVTGGVSYSWNTGAATASVLLSPSATTTYTVTVTNSAGCSASASRIVTVNPLPVVTIEPGIASLCSGQTITLIASGGSSYSWSNAVTTADNTVSPLSNTTYSVTATDDNGCSGTASKSVTVKLQKTSSVNVSICNGESYFAGGLMRTVSGIYYDTLESVNGCDSVVTTHLSVHPVYLMQVNVSVCEGSGILAGGAYRTQAGIYYDTLSSRFGCDSVIATVLSINPYIYQSRNISACRGESVYAGGGYQITSGTYYDTLPATVGCDTVMTTFLTFYNVDTTIIDVLVHAGDSYFAGGAMQTVSGTYFDVLNSAHGCDSVVVTVLSVENIMSELTVNAARGTLTIRTALEKDYADNTYGATVIGWPVTRTLDSLINSDRVQLALYDASGEKKLDFSVDYFSQSPDAPSGYKSMGVTGGEGQVLVGSDTSILNATTSINENFNTYGYVLLQNSPATDTNYTPNPDYPHWIYEVWYEATVRIDAFGNSGFGFHDVVSTHASPDKDDIYKSHVPDSIVPRSCPRDEFVKILICEGSSYFVGGAYQTVPGIYYDTVVTANNCTVIVVSELIVMPVPVTEVNVSICPGESYFAGGNLRQTSGTYYDTLKAVNACDSIIKTNITVLPELNSDIFISICEGNSYFAGGAVQTTTGVYTDVLTASSGCDSTVTTHLTVFPALTVSRTEYICEGDSIFAGGRYQTQSGIYNDTFVSLSGCDSVVVTMLVVQPAVIELSHVSICEGDSFFAGGAYRKTDGVYRDTFLSATGCDSIRITDLTVNVSNLKKIDANICSGDSLFSGGAWQTTDGIYYDTLTNRFGCDSIVRTHLTVNAAIMINKDTSICYGESYFVGGGYQYAAGRYYDTFVAAGGCDSIIITDLFVSYNASNSISLLLCAGEGVFAGGVYRTTSGVYIDTFTAANGCDSIVTILLEVLPLTIDTVEAAICNGESYFAGGANQNSSGIYFDTLSGSNGCDSVVVTWLSLDPVHLVTAEIFICENDSFFAGGAFRHSAGIYYDTLLSSLGCDSIVLTDLKIHPNNLKKVDVRICDGDSMFVGGEWQTTPGIYFDTLVNRFGCDSVVRTNLTFEPAILSNYDVAICEGDYLFVGGAYQSSAGTYYDTLTAAAGCDSIIATNLSLIGMKLENADMELCAGDSFYFGGSFITGSGIYFDTLLQASGCDSVIIMHVSLIEPVMDTVFAAICDNQSYFAGGGWQNAQGIYYDTLPSYSGCDSIVMTVLNVVSTFETTVNISICEGESYYAGGSYRTTDGIYSDTFTSVYGCDSLVTTILSVLEHESVYNPVTICWGQSYFAGGQERTTAGIYLDTLSTAFGCDSIVLTILNIRPPITKTFNVSICSNDEYFAGGAWTNMPGVYIDTFVASTGCDSIVTTNLSVRQSYQQNRTIAVCSGDSVFLQGRFRSISGVYNDTIAAVNGCDSIITTNLIIKDHIQTYRVITICEGESIFTGGAYQTESGIYRDTLIAANGCDSLVVTDLVVIPSARTTLDITICDGESYDAGGGSKTQAGVYYDTLVAINGCDSIVITQLSVLPSYSITVPVSICQGESYFAGNAYQTETGVYYDTLSASNGCDSVVATSLTVFSSHTEYKQVTICAHEQYFAGGEYRNVTGIYMDTFPAANGCDSIIITDLTVLSDFTTINPVTICEGDGYFAQGMLQTTSGTYYDTLVAPNGCYQLIITELNVLPVGRTNIQASICPGEEYFAHGAWQTTSGVYSDTFFSSNGCDSVVTTFLTVLPEKFVNINIEICSNESYYVQGAYRNVSGRYFDTLRSVNGCDSIIITDLNVRQVSTQVVNAEICAGEYYLAGGSFQNTTGTYYDTITGINGCDSVVITHLTVFQNYVINLNHEICDGERILLGGEWRTAAGTYYDSLFTAKGCDSVIIHHLNVAPVNFTHIEVSICENEIYFAGGNYQNSSGIYYDTLTNHHGCDSIVITELTVWNAAVTTVSASICLGDTYYAGGMLQSLPGTYYDTLTGHHGCDSTVITHLSVLQPYYQSNFVSICAGDSVYLQGAYRHLPGSYRDTLTSVNGCDTIIKTQLTVLPRPIVYQYFTICSNERIFLGGREQTSSGTYYDTLTASSGCDSIIVSYLTVLPATSVNHSYTICDGESILISGEYRSRAGIYFDTLTGYNGCDSVIIATLTVNPTPEADAGNDQTICNGSSAQLTASGGDTYLWSTFETTETINITPSNSITLYVTVTNSFGCVDSDSVSVIVDPLLLVSFTGLDTAYCTNDAGDTLVGSPAGGVFTGSGISGNFFNPELLASGYHIITYQYTSQQGCQANSSSMVRIKLAPQASFMGLDSAYCDMPVSHSLIGFPAGGIFSGPGISGNLFTPSDAGVGSHGIVYRYATPDGCVSSEEKWVTVHPLPQINFLIADSVACISESPVQLRATPGGGLFAGAGVIDSTFYPMLAGAGNQAITYTTHPDSNGCWSSSVKTIQVKNNPLVSISRLAPGYCMNQGDVMLNAVPSGGTFHGRGITDNKFNTWQAGIGEHYISYSYIDTYNCMATDTAKVKVYEIPHVEIAGIRDQYCVDAAPVFLSGVPSGGTFTGNGVIVNVFDPGKAGVGGPYAISYRYTNAYRCTAADTQWVIIQPLPVLNADSINHPYCLEDTPVRLTASPAGGNFFGPGISDNQFISSLAGIGTHNIIYSYTDSNQCNSNIPVTVVVEICSGMPELTSGGLEIYPNPFFNFIHLHSFTQPASITVHLTDILGQVVFKQNVSLQQGQNKISLELPEWLVPGVYHLEVIAGDKHYVKQLVKD